MLLNDLTALERQCLWPSCRIPISRVYATVEMKREQGLYRAPGLSDYCLKTKVFCPWQRVDWHRGSARPQLFSFSLGWGFIRAHLCSPACLPACLFTIQPHCKAYSRSVSLIPFQMSLMSWVTVGRIFLSVWGISGWPPGQKPASVSGSFFKMTILLCRVPFLGAL